MRALLPLLFLATPLFAQQDEVKRLQAEIEQLRVEKNALQDRAIADARRFDEVKRRLQEEKEKLQNENARLEKELAEAKGGLPAPAPRKDPAVKPPAPVKDAAPGSLESTFEKKEASVNFDMTPVAEAGAFLQDMAGAPVGTEGEVEGLTISIRAPRISLRVLFDLLAGNTRDSAGDLVEMEWKVVEGKVVIRRKPE